MITKLNVKKMLVFLMIFTVILVSGGFDSQVDASSEKKELIVYVRQEINVDFDLFEESTIDIFKQTGWTITDNGAYRLTPLKYGKVLSDESVVDVEAGEKVLVPRNTKNLYFTEDKEDLSKKVTLNKNKDKEIVIFTVDIFDALNKMDEAHFHELKTNSKLTEWKGKEFGSKYYRGDWVHCNRFNGPDSDSVHYDKKKNPIKAARNFAGSDCDVALSRSNMCIFSKHCNQNGNRPADCSSLVGNNGKSCSRKFHKHTKPPKFLR